MAETLDPAIGDGPIAVRRRCPLCHGWAGLLQATWRAALDAGAHGPLAALVSNLRAHLDHYLRTHATPATHGLLEGAVGIQLARHTTAGTTPPRSGWDACLLLDVDHPRRRP